MEDPNKVMYFAETDARNKRIRFGIKTRDRSRHMYIIGKTGMGKSTLLENLAIQDIRDGHSIAFIDPHGKTADLLLDYVPEDRIKDVLYFAPFDLDYPISFNVLEDVGPDKRHLVANGLMSAFKKIWVDAWSARMEYILNNILLALLEYPDSTIIGVNRMLADEAYREKVVEHITDPSVRSFWVDEFAKYGPRYMQEAGAAIQNKIGQFISNPLIRNIIGQPKSTFDIRTMMDEKKIIIINLSKGRVGEANANLLGGMLITKIYLAAMSRADIRDDDLQKLPNFYLYVDEFQNFANESFADILSEARKYKLNLTVAHQYIEQMTEEVRAAVFGNVGTMITFRVGAYDAEILEKEFAPQFTSEDLVNLGFAQIYLKLMIDGVSSRPFSATTLAPIARPEVYYRNEIIENSRNAFANPRSVIEENIRKWHEDSSENFKGQNKQKKSSAIESAMHAVLGNSKNVNNDNKSLNRDVANKVEDDNINKLNVVIKGNQEKETQDKSSTKNDRENALRKAVSLSYLRQTGKLQNQKEKKAPTEEHLSELRSALSSLLGGDSESHEISSDKVVNESVIKKDKSNSFIENKINSEENSNKDDKKDDVNSSFLKNEKEKRVDEVPEEVLRRILDI